MDVSDGLTVAKAATAAKGVFDYFKARSKSAEEAMKLMELHDAFQALRDENSQLRDKNSRLRDELRQRDVRASARDAYERKQIRERRCACSGTVLTVPTDLRVARNAKTNMVSHFHCRGWRPRFGPSRRTNAHPATPRSIFPEPLDEPEPRRFRGSGRDRRRDPRRPRDQDRGADASGGLRRWPSCKEDFTGSDPAAPRPGPGRWLFPARRALSGRTDRVRRRP